MKAGMKWFWSNYQKLLFEDKNDIMTLQMSVSKFRRSIWSIDDISLYILLLKWRILTMSAAISNVDEQIYCIFNRYWPYWIRGFIKMALQITEKSSMILFFHSYKIWLKLYYLSIFSFLSTAFHYFNANHFYLWSITDIRNIRYLYYLYCIHDII